MFDSKRMLELYPKYESMKEFYDSRIEGVSKLFADVYKKDTNLLYFSAPGRIEIGGNHTDHQHGCVFAAAIGLDIIGAFRQNGESIVRLHSEGFPFVCVR